MTKELSDKIKLISLICTVMVVYRHAHTFEAFRGDGKETWEIYNFIAHGVTYLTSIAVPYFFLISGFFFFKQSYYENGNYTTMIRKKVQTLFIPFLIWNLLAFVPLWISGKVVIEDHWYMYVVDLLHSDYNGPLWYVRTLMLLMLMSPLYDWIFFLEDKIGRKWELVIQSAIIAYIIYIWWPMDSKVLSTEGWLFFLLGGVIRKHEGCLRKKLNKVWAILLYFCWVVSCFFIMPNYWTDKIHLLLGVFLFWNFIRTGCRGWIASMAGYAFFIYVNHFILLKVIKTIFAHFFLGNEIAALLTFLISPIFVVYLMWKVGELWHRIYPKSFAWITGGRA